MDKLTIKERKIIKKIISNFGYDNINYIAKCADKNLFGIVQLQLEVCIQGIRYPLWLMSGAFKGLEFYRKYSLEQLGFVNND